MERDGGQAGQYRDPAGNLDGPCEQRLFVWPAVVDQEGEQHGARGQQHRGVAHPPVPRREDLPDPVPGGVHQCGQQIVVDGAGGADREHECPADRVAVRGDHPPGGDVHAVVQFRQAHPHGVRLVGRAGVTKVDLLTVAVVHPHRPDFRGDRLVEPGRHLVRPGVELVTIGRRGLQELRVGRRWGREQGEQQHREQGGRRDPGRRWLTPRPNVEAV